MKLSKRNVALIIALCSAFSLAFSLLFTKAIEQSSSVVNIPQLMNYQGRLTDNGNPITGSVIITFSIYDVPTGGSPLWTETQNVTVTNGIFNVLLGSANPLTPSVFSSGETYLGIQIEGNSEVQPRQQFVSAAYAFFANNANTVNGQTPAEILASHTQDVPHMLVFVGSAGWTWEYQQRESTTTAPQQAKMAIINTRFESSNVYYYGQIMLAKEGCTSAGQTWYANMPRTVSAQWNVADNTITINRSQGLVYIGVNATAYFYR